MRKLWIDDLRTKVVCLVMLFHVFYYYSSCCHGSNYGGFADVQWQDGIVYILYPWMMILLFIISGVCSRLAVNKYSAKEWIRTRTVRLLVPGTIGLLVFQWTAGYFNMATAAHVSGVDISEMPFVIRYLIYSVIGGGHLWYIQLLWVFALLTPWLPQPKREPRWLWAYLVLGFLLLFAAEQTVAELPNPQSPLSLYNVFRPVVYLTCYLLGFYVFVEEKFLDLLDRLRWPLYVFALAGAGLIAVFTFGEEPYGTAYLRSWYNNLYAWVVSLAMIAFFRRNRNEPQTNRVLAWAEAYTNKCSYGLYLLHYLIIAGVGYSLRTYTTLPAWADYTILFVAVFTLTPLLYEVIRRIPVVRWCVLGVN